MMKLHRSVTRLILLASLAGALAGALAAAEVQGILMDKNCSMKAVKEGQQAAVMHTRECALMPESEKSGYGVFTADNRFLVFDAAGNKQASKALKASTKKDNLKVKVKGEIDGDTIKVATLKLQ
jgi:hypothetical protein